MANPFASFLFLLQILIFTTSPSTQLQITRTKLDPIDVAALASIKDSLTDLPGSNFFSTWDFASPDPCSTFNGITCSVNRVSTLTLGSGLAGSLSPSLCNLTGLTQLLLYPGFVTGPIPTQLGQLSNLRVISLTHNRLTGSIPNSLASIPNLHTLDLSYNRLTGSVPPGLFSELTNLKVLVLAFNSLSGELPRTVSTQLLHMDLKGNEISGELPLKLPSSIRYMSLSNNMMWGPLNGLTPSLSELVYLDLSMNQFNGSIPSSLIRYSLSSLFLQRNNLSGWVPSMVGPRSSSSYGPGSIVDLSHNSLSGELPLDLAGVETLFLNNNRLIGRVPHVYVDAVYSGNTRTLYLQHNYLTGFATESGESLPDAVSLCLAYNCMAPLVGLTVCPASAGDQVSRPKSQCALFNKGNSTH